VTTVDQTTEFESPAFDAGLLLGPAALDPAYRSQVHGFLRQLARARGIPLHPAVAWNALYWGWDPSSGAYDVDVLPLEQFPVLRMGERGPAIPVGAMAQVQSGGEPIWGEAIYKEGRSPLVGEDGAVPAELSGAAVTLDESGIAVLSEAVVVDFAAGGAGADIEQRVRRWARNGRWLDSHGHVVLDAVYDPGHDADLDDLHFFACWLWSQHFSALEHGWFRLHLGDSLTRPELWQALTASLDCVAALLATTEGLRRWGSYYVDEAVHQERLAAVDAVLGGADLEHLAASLRLPQGDERIGYVALRPRLLELAPGSPQLDWTAYPATVCRASSRIAELAAAAVPDGLALRVDDLWQSGGIWRAERLDPTSYCRLLAVPPDQPLGCGAAGEAADRHVPAAPAGVEPEAAVSPAEEVEEFADTFLQWTATLRQVDLEGERLPLSEAASAALHPTAEGTVLLRLEHQGDVAADEAHQPRCRLADDGRHLLEVHWPVDFFSGIRVWASVQRDGSVIQSATLPQEPVLAGGELRAFEFDAGVLCPGQQATEGAGSQPVTLRRLLVEALRRRGRIDDAGDRRAEAEEIAGLAFPRGVPEGAMPAVRRALDACVADGDLRTDGEEYIASLTRVAAPLPPDWGASAELRQRMAKREHRVRLHFRRLRTSQWASEERRAEYRELIRARGLLGVARAELPRGYTFVIEHVRGAHGAFPSAASDDAGTDPTLEFP
jgi:hypothetical protein